MAPQSGRGSTRFGSARLLLGLPCTLLLTLQQGAVAITTSLRAATFEQVEGPSTTLGRGRVPLVRHHHYNPDVGEASSSTFDFYCLATFWPAELCHSDKSESCTAPKSYWKGHLTGHGLWPNNADGTYPQFCEGEAFNRTITDDDVGLDIMETYWPNLSKDPPSSHYDDLWKHEWEKVQPPLINTSYTHAIHLIPPPSAMLQHGTCSGMSQPEYFATTLSLFKTFTPPQLTNAVTSSLLRGDNGEVLMARADLEAAFGGGNRVVLGCGGGKYLQSAMTCWDKGGQGNGPLQPRDCPPAVRKEDSCTADPILIPAFAATLDSTGALA